MEVKFMFFGKTKSLEQENNELKQQIIYLQSQLNPTQQQLLQAQMNLNNINNQLNIVNSNYQLLLNNYEQLSNQIKNLNQQISFKQNQLIWLEEDIMLQDFGLYKPIYNFDNSEIYKQHLDEIRNQQKLMIKNDQAVFYNNSFTLNGSAKEGQKMIKDNVKQILKTFNEECETIIDKVKYNNVEKIKQRIIKSSESLNKLNARMEIQLNCNYVNLKIDELFLVYEYQCKKQQEKEEERIRREEQKEQQRVQKELEEARKTSEKENSHYKKALDNINNRLLNCNTDEEREILLEKQNELQSKVYEIENELKNLDYRIANQRAGYVYIISNIGAFGENIYKIGMTRRLDPQDRIDELSNASVPFPYDVHAMIFSNDAPTLENMLHQHFSNNKVNQVNERKEFFNVSLEEIENFVKQNYDNSIEFKKIPEAKQYRETKKIKENY